MAIGLVGRKCGMTRIFTDAGVSVPVTVIEVDPTVSLKSKRLKLMVIKRFKSLLVNVANLA
jgi:large subunit ribosomal protein L3